MTFKKLVISFVFGTMLAILPIFAFPKTVNSIIGSVQHKVSKTTSECPESIGIEISGPSGTTYYACGLDGSDANWCYYTCYGLYHIEP